jgi:hypothetical protein
MRSALRYFIAFGLIVLVAVAAISFFSGRDNDSGKATKPAEKQLADYATSDASLRLTVSGSITADEDFRTARVTVTPTSRSIEILKGYQKAVERRRSYPNNRAAYRAFVQALAGTGYTAQRETKIDNEQRACPLGKRYVYELIERNKSVLRSWSTSCGREGSFAGKADTVRQLFRLQIPDYQNLIEDTGL